MEQPLRVPESRTNPETTLGRSPARPPSRLGRPAWDSPPGEEVLNWVPWRLLSPRMVPSEQTGTLRPAPTGQVSSHWTSQLLPAARWALGRSRPGEEKAPVPFTLIPQPQVPLGCQLQPKQIIRAL
ncbi:uncharacterized protein LOC125124809 isoform X3 [Phacochoerus africanus]|uniref:uncharacterized protein LOC125124809 isoform X3 n=1 Tax=Phacochoerus africanus TaxID=41426 RepID=UPI001FDA06AD|nr:uncharacterized protein LOC125124809 isoform X3 [Phacochoerus africanus]